MASNDLQQSRPLRTRSPVTAGAILLGIFIALSLAVGGVVHIVELVRAADVPGPGDSADPPVKEARS